MKLDFIVTGLPRSGTTWAANWLTTDNSICWHDATGNILPEELDRKLSSKKYRGISCTGAWVFKEWLESHPAKVIILERDIDEINASLRQIGIPAVTENAVSFFRDIKGIRVPYTDLFERPEELWNYLLPNIAFDEERHRELAKMLIQPTEEAQIPDADYVKHLLGKFSSRLAEIM